jgi:hypothetical protein
MNLSRNVLFLSMVLLLAVPQDSSADDKIVVRRQVKKAGKKAGKKATIPVSVEAKPSLTDSCGPTPSSPLPCSGPPFVDGTAALDAVCTHCADHTTTASKFEKLRTAPTPAVLLGIKHCSIRRQASPQSSV